MKEIAILGSTGSIGQSTLEVVRRFPRRFCVRALSARSNIALLGRQIREFRPKLVCVEDALAARELKKDGGLLGARLLLGREGLEEAAGSAGIELVVLAISGSAALQPLLKAISRGKDVALANKEALVMAGPLVMAEARRRKSTIIPIDSEQSAIWQCLQGQERSRLARIYLTASGGPFRNVSTQGLKDVSVARVIRHPRWRMGKKISVDSATLMNKGFELLEAMYLFDVPASMISILVHPEAIIHSMVEFVDAVVLAQLSVTDMRIPIQYALAYPERLAGGMPAVDFCRLKHLTFEAPDIRRFPCLRLAYEVAQKQQTFPCVLNAADEACVNAFLCGRLPFLSIAKVIERVLSRHRGRQHPNLKDILEADVWAREEALRSIG